MKIKILGTTGLLYVLRLTALAQTDTNSKPLLRECVSINSGIAIPGTVIPSTNPGLGRANEGFSANAYGFIAKRKSLIGFAAFISENINPTVLTNENFGNPTTQIATVSELGIDLGLCIDIPFSRFSLNVRAMLGPAFSTWPSLSYINYFGSGVNFNPGMSCAISFDAGISLRYALSKKMSLSFVSDFFSTYPRYTASGNYQGEEIDANLVLNNYTIGVAYTIGEYAPPAPYVPSFVDSLQMDSIPQDTAKKTYPKAYVYLNGGIGDPGYKFRWFNSAGIGGAIIGNTYSASINIPINHSKMGISLLAGGGFNGFSTQAFNGWEGDQLDEVVISNQGSPANFSESYGMIGGFITIIGSDVLSFDFRALFGGLYYNSPDISYSVYKDNPAISNSPLLYTKHIASHSAFTPVFDIGAAMKFNLLKRLYVTLNLDIVSTPFDIVSLTNETVGLGVRL